MRPSFPRRGEAEAGSPKTKTPLSRCFGFTHKNKLLQRLHDVLEHFRFVLSEVGENLTVDFDVGLQEGIDELGVGRAVHAGGGVDLDGPEFAELALLFLAVGELEAPGVQGGFFSLAVFRFAGPQKALRVFEKSFAASYCSWSSFYA